MLAQPATANINGPASSTDTALARWNGTGGNALQNTSGVTSNGTNLTATAAIRCSTATALATSGTISVDPTLGEVFTCTPSNACTFNFASAPVDAKVVFVFTTSGVSSFTMTFGTNGKSTGTLATGTSSGKVFTVSFIGDGTNMNETARTTAM